MKLIYKCIKKYRELEMWADKWGWKKCWEMWRTCEGNAREILGNAE